MRACPATIAVLLAAVAWPLCGQIGQADGYRGIWYSNQPLGNRYVYKYSGGFATYPQQHIPIAVYSKKANKTFFCYGGTVQGRQELLHMVSYYDHKTGMVPRPTILLDKKTGDAHDNPVLSIDDEGYIWIFSNAHGITRPAWVHRSKRPFSVDEFEEVLETNFSYAQPHHLFGKGFLLLETLYRAGGRSLFWTTSRDGVSWTEPQLLARIARGHYQVSWQKSRRVGTAFNYHPDPVGLNARTNLYYLETDDLGQHWRTAAGKPVAPPIDSAANPALVHDFEAEGELVYLKDLAFDSGARPVICFLTSKGFEPGPENGPRHFQTARWNGVSWEIRPITTTDHNYDHGSFYIEEGGVWRFIAPTAPGPQPDSTGGEIEMWISRDRGRSWRKIRRLTHHSRFNHTYVRRPVNAHPDFYALWADGNALSPSISRLYFTNREGDRVYRLPLNMKTPFAKPEPIP